jgi:hypothetical protein
VARLRHGLDTLLAHLQIEIADEGQSEAHRLAVRHHKLDAIKEYLRLAGREKIEANSVVERDR